MTGRVPAPLTVAIVQGTADIAGAERQLLAELAGLEPSEVQVRVLLFGDGPLAAQLSAAGAQVARLGDLPRARDPRGWRAVIGQIAVAARGVDLLHAQGEKLVPVAAAAGRRLGIPVVRHLHDRPARSAAALGLHLASRAVRTRGVTVVPSGSMQGQLRRLAVRGAVVIPNGIDLADLPADPLPREALGVPADALLVVLPGRLQRWKGQAQAIRALAAARAQVPSLHLVLLGDALFGLEPEFPGELRRLVRELGLEGAVTFAGHRDDPLAVMAAADVVLHASLQPEPFGMVVLEGMALGRPVIAAASGGPAELIDDGLTGVLADPSEVEALAGALVRVASDATLRARLGVAAQEVVAARYSARAIGQAWTECYRALAT